MILVLPMKFQAKPILCDFRVRSNLLSCSNQKECLFKDLIKKRIDFHVTYIRSDCGHLVALANFWSLWNNLIGLVTLWRNLICSTGWPIRCVEIYCPGRILVADWNFCQFKEETVFVRRIGPRTWTVFESESKYWGNRPCMLK